jgi:hypothetical protein
MTIRCTWFIGDKQFQATHANEKVAESDASRAALDYLKTLEKPNSDPN